MFNHYQKSNEESRKIYISLTQENPLSRLKELASTSDYKFHFLWRPHDNGIMMMCELFFIVYDTHNKRKFVVNKEAQFVERVDNETEEQNIDRAKNVVAALLLDNVGLSPPVKESTFFSDVSELATNIEDTATNEGLKHVAESLASDLFGDGFTQLFEN